MKIALVQPPHYFFGNRKDKTGEYFIPLGLLALHAGLGGHEVTVVNLNLPGDARRLKGRKYDLVGIRCASMDRDYTVRLARELKKRDRRQTVVAGGPHPTLCPEDMLKEKSIDYVVRGAGERALPQLVEALETGTGAETIEGVCFRRKNGNRIGDIAVIRDMDSLPLPSYTALDLDRYLAKSGGWLPYETARGCVHRCLYCSIWKSYDRIYAKSIPRVMADIETILKLHDAVRVIGIEDNTFNYSRERVFAFCRGIRKLSKKLDREIQWKTSMRADSIDERLLRAMKEGGLASAFVGFETASQKSMDRLRKGQDIKKMLGVLDLFLRYRVPVQASFQIGLPWETAEEMWETVKLAAALQRKGVHTTLLKSTLLPGTDIARYAPKARKDSGEEYSLNLPYGNAWAYRHPVVATDEMRRMVEYYQNEKRLDCFIRNRLPGANG